MVIFSHPMRKGTAKSENARLSISLLKKACERRQSMDHFWADHMFADLDVRLSFLMCHGSHPNWITPKFALCPNLHLLMTFFRQLPSSGQAGMPFQ